MDYQNELELLDVGQMAELLNVKKSWVRQAIFRKKLPGVVRIGRLVRGHKKDLLKWLEELKKK